MVLTILERFSGYTYTTLMQEDSELIHLLAIEKAGKVEGGEVDG